MRTAALFLFSLAAFAQSNYVGSKACFACHSEIYKSYQSTAMGRSITLASDWKPGTLPAQATVQRYAVSHNDLGWKQSETEPGVFSVEHQLDYVVGSGSNGLTFLIHQGNYLLQAPLSFYSRSQKWDLSPGYETADLGFTRVVPQECINCHAGRPAPLPNASAAYADPPFQELAIGCENCHGPGQLHIASLGKAKGSIVNPAKLSPALADNICVNCHQAGDARVAQPGKTYLDFRPGQWSFNTAVIFKKPPKTSGEQADLLEHYSAMQASRCFRESAGKLSCLTCHNPHVQPESAQAASYYRAKCLTCHSEQSCKISLKVRAAQNPADNCIGCHMPKRSVTQISHSALTNHRIPARDDEPLPIIPATITDGVVVVNPPAEPFQLPRVVLLKAYQQLSETDRFANLLNELARSQPQDTYVQAALGDRAYAQGQMQEAIPHLKQAIVGEHNPGLNLELGDALAKTGQSQEAIQTLRTGVELDPFNAVMQKTLILQYINLKMYPEARSLMQQYVTTFPDDTFMRSLLARVSTGSGK